MFVFSSSFTVQSQMYKYIDESYWNTTSALQLHFLCLLMFCQLIHFPSGIFCSLDIILQIMQKKADGHHILGNIYTSYLSLAKTMTLLKRNRCLSLVFEPSVTWTHSSSSSSPFSLVRPRTNGLCSTDTQQEASSLDEKTHTKKVGDRDNSQPQLRHECV